MTELSPSQIGGLGVAALLVLCFIGVRFAFAAAIVGTAGLTMLIGWDAGLRTAGIVPYAAGANYTLSVLPMFILIGYLAYYAGITQTAFEAARRPCYRHRVRGRRLLRRVWRQQRGGCRVRQGGDS